MKIIDMTDEKIYELAIKVLTENLGLTRTMQFHQICQPHKDDAARVGQKLSHLQMERIRAKVYEAYTAKQRDSENEHIKKIASPSDIVLYELGIKTISDELGPVGMARFIRICKPNPVNYTEDRHKWLDKLNRETILAGIQEIQQEYLAEKATEKK